MAFADNLGQFGNWLTNTAVPIAQQVGGFLGGSKPPAQPVAPAPPPTMLGGLKLDQNTMLLLGIGAVVLVLIIARK